MKERLMYLVYISLSTKLMEQDDLFEILEQSRSNNERHGITGMLIYMEGRFLTRVQGRFMQVLEGKEEDIDLIFGRIMNDRRHTGVIVVSRQPLGKRHFEGWSMGFETGDQEHFHQSGSYFSLDEHFLEEGESETPSAALRFLKSFYKINQPQPSGR
jgi:hypothetical protein